MKCLSDDPSDTDDIGGIHGTHIAIPEYHANVTLRRKGNTALKHLDKNCNGYNCLSF